MKISDLEIDEFRRVIDRNWAQHFGCPVAVLRAPGTTVLPEDRYAGDGVIVLWHIGERVFVQFDPACADRLAQALRRFPPDHALSGHDLVRAWGAESVKSHDTGLVHYLYPPDLPDYTPPLPFALRHLTPADGDSMLALHNANTPEDVDEGYVEVMHEIAFGCFANDQLVAAASGYQRAGFMDVGVLTHPEFRRKGLGKAVVGAVCEWSIRQGFIAQYRNNVQNVSSHGVAKTLNFRLYFKSESVWL